MLDTNIVSNLMADQAGRIAKRLFALGDPPTAMSVVVAGEVLFGAERVGSARIRMRFEKLLQFVEVLPLEPSVGERYAVVRADLERRGTPIGANDLFIAAHAMALGATLVTDDGDFARVEGLAVENWLRG